nr:MAG TPA: hypothetical protein [Caudoviricetes sp.]
MRAVNLPDKSVFTFIQTYKLLTKKLLYGII